jgi:hypothetical protein
MVSISGTILTFTEVGIGNAEITVELDDGAEREGGTVTETLVVIVNESTVEYTYFLDLLSVPSGTNVMDYSMADGTHIGTEEGGDDSDRVVKNGELEWTVNEYDVMSITFPSPINLQADATFEFEYAGVWNDDFGFAIIDSKGEEVSFGYGDGPFKGSMVVDDPAYNKFSFNLADYSKTVDLSSVAAIYFEKYETVGTLTFKLRNLGIGISEPVWEMNFGSVAGGTSYDGITLADETVIGREEGSDGSSRIVQNGVLEWTTDEYDVMSVTFSSPIDISNAPLFSMEYAELWNDMFGFTIFDSSGKEAAFGWEELPFLEAMVIDDDSYNTFSFDISEYAPDLDFTSITGFYLEKFEAEQLETFKVKKISLGN